VSRGADRAPARELLLANHAFPGEYIVKAFGPGAGEFREAVAAVAVAVVGEARVVVSHRSTRSGAQICVTLTLHAETVDEVIEVYAGVHAVPGLMLIL
jgi:putative lipoic acid-binding regulatory protein